MIGHASETSWVSRRARVCVSLAVALCCVLSACRKRRTGSNEPATSGEALVASSCMDPEDQRDEALSFELRRCLGDPVPGYLSDQKNDAGDALISFKAPGMKANLDCEWIAKRLDNLDDERITWQHPEKGVMYHARELMILENGRGQFVATARCQKTYAVKGLVSPGSSFSLLAHVEFPDQRPAAGLINAKVDCTPTLLGWAVVQAGKAANVGEIEFQFGYDPSIKSVKCTTLQVFHDGLAKFSAELGSTKDGVTLNIDKAGDQVQVSDKLVKLAGVTPQIKNGVVVETKEAKECPSGKYDIEKRECLPK